MLLTVTDTRLYKEVLHGVLYPKAHGNEFEKKK